MRLVNISENHYIIVDDLDIEIGDWVYVYCSEIEVEEICQIIDYNNEQFIFRDGSQIHLDYCHKITHSTKPIEVYYDDMTGKEVWHYDKVQYFMPQVQGNNLNPFIQKKNLPCPSFRKIKQKWDMIWEHLQAKLPNKVSHPLEEKIRDKVFYNILAQTESQLYFQTLNNLKK